ncbi:MAG: hypothetical protein P4L31_02270 [Candidatus Babeliales bacterium]|nr:hypothetical protein [Candidatus Babeliales bacterium]
MNLIKCCLSIMILLISMATNPMGARLKQAILQNQSSLKLTAGFGTIMIGCSAYQFNAHKKELLALPDASPQEQKFAREQFKAVGIKDPTSIKVKIGDQMSCFDDIVMINKDYKRQMLLTQKKYEEFEILEFQGSLQHEGNHVKFKHKKKGVAIYNIIASISCYHAVIKTKKPLSAIALFLLAPSAIHHAYRYHAECQADNHIQNNPIMLRALAKSFKENHDNYYQHLSTWEQLKDVHPHPLKRAQKLEERAKQAESAQQN